MAIRNEKLSKICNYCGKHNALYKCDKCNVQPYCNKNCQKYDKYHKTLCAEENSTEPKLDTRIFRLIKHDIDKIYDQAELPKVDKLTQEQAESLSIKLHSKFRDGSI
jgi:sulfatase maturation enzyme AslB (radical SAM superfamily)